MNNNDAAARLKDLSDKTGRYEKSPRHSYPGIPVEKSRLESTPSFVNDPFLHDDIRFEKGSLFDLVEKLDDCL